VRFNPFRRETPAKTAHIPTVEEHENEILAQIWITYGNEPRFIKQADGSVWCTAGRYRFKADYWRELMEEFRHPDANHTFQSMLNVREVHNNGKWDRVGVLCTKCGEQRMVYHAMTLDELNRDGWCIK
jgi:hypothetical protein